MANNNNADLFISVHCNSGPSKAYGVETFLMGLHVSQANLDVAKRENAVIKLEKDYQKTYDGFDPDSPEAIIALSLAQGANIEQSSFLASKVQEQLTSKLGRYNRGVKQAGFWVLYRTTCPSILIETGFLTNKTEEAYLTSSDGQNDIAKSIFHAFEDYRNTIEKGGKLIPPTISNSDNNTKEETEPSKPIIKTPIIVKEPKIVINNNTSTKEIIYKVQIKTSSKPLPKSDKAFKLMSDIKYEKVSGLYKYTCGPYEDYSEALKMQKKAKTVGYKDAFIAVYKNGERLTFDEAKNYFK
jgi:N-acetylmuramoyl-L-alanine amidase